MISVIGVDSQETKEKQLPSAGGNKRRKVEPLEQAILEVFGQTQKKSMSEQEKKLEMTKTKVDLFKLFDSKSPKEIKEVLEIYKDFDI